jgi:hypothetical protein
MKKVTFMVAAFAALSLVSCSKERTCACTSTSTESGTYYTDVYDATTGQSEQTSSSYSESDQSTSETKYTKISKKAGNQSCPESSTSSDPYDNTYVDFNGFTQGSKGTYTYTTTCELK